MVGGDLFSPLCRANIDFCGEKHHDDIKERKIGLFCRIALNPAPLITSNFLLQETFRILKVDVLQVSPPPQKKKTLHACMCVSVECVWEFKRKDSRCKNMVGGRERECSQVQQPLATGDARVSSIPRFLPARPLSKPPVQSCRAHPFTTCARLTVL